MEKKKRGFAAMSPEKRKEIASKGGKRAHLLGTAHKYTPAEARVAGRLGSAARKTTPGDVQKEETETTVRDTLTLLAAEAEFK
jgi:general stress protein YciG